MINAGNNLDIEAHGIDLAADYIFKALALSGTEIIAPGVSEIAWGTEKLKRLAENTGLTFISANLPEFTPYAVLKKNNGRTTVLVTAVIDPAMLPADHKTRAISDPVAALRDIQKQVPHDLFVAIIHADGNMISSILEQCPGIDLVIDGLSTQSVLTAAAGDQQAPIVANNNQGMDVAYIDYTSGEKGAGDFSRPFQVRITAGEVAEDPVISALIKEYNNKRQALLEMRPGPLKVSTAELEAHTHYVGSQSCQLCHPAFSACWTKTRHAGAMESLSAMSRQNDPSCLYCHVTGLEKKPPQDLTMAKSKMFMPGVQCEACHGPGKNHSQDPQSFSMLSINESTCTRCHTKFRDPEFDFQQDLDRLNCGLCPDETGCETN